MDNIPQGYDENGVRNGNGKWYEIEQEEQEIGTFDEYDYYRELREADKGHFVECDECGRLTKKSNTIEVWYGTGFLCKNCRGDLDN